MASQRRAPYPRRSSLPPCFQNRRAHRGLFPLSDQQSIRNRFSKAFRFVVSQPLLPRRDGKRRVAVLEILQSTIRTREYVEKGESEGKSLLDAMTDDGQESMQHFHGELQRIL